MDIESTRSLLSALIGALPTVMSLGLVALFAFPKPKSGFIKNSALYAKSMISVTFLIGIFIASIFSNIMALANINDSSYVIWGVGLSIVAFMAMPIFLLWYLVQISQL